MQQNKRMVATPLLLPTIHMAHLYCITTPPICAIIINLHALPPTPDLNRLLT